MLPCISFDALVVVVYVVHRHYTVDELEHYILELVQKNYLMTSIVLEHFALMMMDQLVLKNYCYPKKSFYVLYSEQNYIITNVFSAI
jgi:hypothetical protein